MNSLISIFFYRAFGVKLWYPQIYQAINDFRDDKVKTKLEICAVIDSLASSNSSVNAVCRVVSTNTTSRSHDMISYGCAKVYGHISQEILPGSNLLKFLRLLLCSFPKSTIIEEFKELY